MNQRRLKRGEIEVTWANNGSREIIQTSGMTYNTGAIVCDVDVHKVIIPLSSVKSFRVLGIAAITEELEAEKQARMLPKQPKLRRGAQRHVRGLTDRAPARDGI